MNTVLTLRGLRPVLSILAWHPSPTSRRYMLESAFKAMHGNPLFIGMAAPVPSK